LGDWVIVIVVKIDEPQDSDYAETKITHVGFV